MVNNVGPKKLQLLGSFWSMVILITYFFESQNIFLMFGFGCRQFKKNCSRVRNTLKLVHKYYMLLLETILFNMLCFPVPEKRGRYLYRLLGPHRRNDFKLFDKNA